MSRKYGDLSRAQRRVVAYLRQHGETGGGLWPRSGAHASPATFAALARKGVVYRDERSRRYRLTREWA